MATQNATKSENTLTRLSRWIIAIILVLLPFHAVFTTWAGSNFGHLDLFRIWKELLMLALAGITAYFLVTDKTILERLKSWWVTWIIAAYSGLTVVMALLTRAGGDVTASAAVYAIIINLRFVGFFLIVWIVAQKTTWLYKNWRKILLIPAVAVVCFGLLQWLVLPNDFLRHVGYGSSTIPAIQTVDQQTDFQRIQSTLRGANPLGAYMVLVISAVLGIAWDAKKRGWLWWVFWATCLVVLFSTYSRSAYIGAAISIGTVCLVKLPRKYVKLALLTAVCVSIVVGVATVALRNNDFVQNTVFHSSEASKSATSSNASRATALKDGLKDMVKEPFGRGPGTAGPASFRNTGAVPRIAENYYIQIAQELGLIGLGLFVAILIGVGSRLWRSREYPLALILFASLIGISFINLISHAWTDDTLSLLWWGFAGIALTPGILNMSKNHENKQTKAQKKPTN